MRFRPWIKCSSIAAALLLSAPSLLALQKTRLVYVRGEGAEGCPEVMELRLAVLHRLGYNPFDPNAKESIVVLIRRRDAVVEATVDLIDDQGLSRGSRLLDAPAKTCDELIAAAALSISLAIDPERALADAKPPKMAADEPSLAALTQQEVLAEPLQQPMTGDVWPAAPAFSPVERARFVPELSLSLQGSSLALVAPALGTSLGIGLRRGPLSLSLEGRLDFPTSSPINDHGGNLTTWLLMGTLAPCLRAYPIRVCALASYGMLRASTTGVARPGQDQVGYAALGARLGTARRVLPRLSLGLHVDLFLTASKYQANLGQSEIWHSHRLSGLLGLDGVWDFE